MEIFSVVKPVTASIQVFIKFGATIKLPSFFTAAFAHLYSDAVYYCYNFVLNSNVMVIVYFRHNIFTALECYRQFLNSFYYT